MSWANESKWLGIAILASIILSVCAGMIGAVPAVAAMTARLPLGYRTATSPADSVLTEKGATVTGHEFHRTKVTAPEGQPAWHLPAGPEGFATPTLHAAYLHTHWAGHPALAQRFAQAVHGPSPR